MSEIAIGTAFWKLVDYAIQLLGKKEHNRKELFQDLIEPLFLELQPVVDDYFSFFRRARTLASAGTKQELEIALGELRQQREAMLRQRIQVRELARALSSGRKDRWVNAFSSNVHGFFNSSTIVSRFARSKSPPAAALELFDYVLAEKINQHELVEYIDSTLRNLEGSWVAIAQNYASLRVHSLSPIGSKLTD